MLLTWWAKDSGRWTWDKKHRSGRDGVSVMYNVNILQLAAKQSVAKQNLIPTLQPIDRTDTSTFNFQLYCVDGSMGYSCHVVNPTHADSPSRFTPNPLLYYTAMCTIVHYVYLIRGQSAPEYVPGHLLGPRRCTQSICPTMERYVLYGTLLYVL